MATSTVIVHEAESQLGSLISQVQQTAEPMLLKEAANRPPVAFIASLKDMPTDGIQTLYGDSKNTLAHHIELLRVLVQLWQESLNEPDASSASQPIMQVLHSRLRLLAQLHTEQLCTNSSKAIQYSTFRAIIMLLRLSIDEIRSASQLQALDYGLEVLLETNLTSLNLAQVDQILLDHGIEAQADLGDTELLQNYVELL